MKKTTCKDLRGACDEIITGNTPQEMGQKSQNHVMEKIKQGDEAHQAAINSMRALSPEEQQAWYQSFVDSFDSLQDA